MYGKLFESMYDGTLAEDWRALITFQQMIILSDADGHVDLTPSALSRRTGIPIEHIKAGIEILEAPDKYSRTEGSDGRRIELIDEHRPWGWVIVNHKMYRDISDAQTVREQTRERVRKHREKKKCNVTVTPSNASNAIQIQDTDTNTIINKPSPKTVNGVPYQKIVDLYHETLPTLPKVEKLTAVRKSQIRQRWLQDLKELDHWENFFEYVKQSKFLMGLVPQSNGRKVFRANLQWLTKEENYVKISEENYHV